MNYPTIVTILIAIATVFGIGTAAQVHAISEECHKLVVGGAVSDGYGASYDVIGNRGQLLKATCDLEAEEISYTVGSGSNSEYVYEEGYRWDGTEWKKYTLGGDKLAGTPWIKQQGNITLNVPAQEMINGSYYVGYVCIWDGSNWKCGCKDNACSQGMWQLQQYQATLPGGPGGPPSSSSSGGSTSGGSTSSTGGGTSVSVTTHTVTELTETSAKIGWSVSEPATGQVEYGINTQYGSQTAKESRLYSAHVQPLTGLTPDTTYYYRINSTDENGATAQATGSFTTQSATVACLAPEDVLVANTHTGSVRTVPMAMPNYLEEYTDTRSSAPFYAPTYKRISSKNTFHPPTQGPDLNNFGPQYALVQHFNADNSKVLVRALARDSNGRELPGYYTTSLHIVDAKTGQYISRAGTDQKAISTRWRWSNADPNEILFVPANQAPKIEMLDISDMTFSERSFAGDGYTKMSRSLFGGNGAQSADDRYWPLTGQKGSQWYLFVWDRVTDSIITEIAIPGDTVDSTYFNAAGMSHSGDYFWLGTQTAWNHNGTTIPKGVSVFARNGTYLRTLESPYGKTYSHAGTTVDVNGNDVWVRLGRALDGPSGQRAVLSWRLDGNNPGGPNSSQETVQTPPRLIPGLHYVSTAAFDAGGWVLVSDYAVETNNTKWSGYPLRGSVWAVKLDGSGTAYPVADARIAQSDFSSSIVRAGFHSWGTPNRNMTGALFKSAFDYDWSDGAPQEAHAILADWCR